MVETTITLPQHASVSAIAAIRAECLTALQRLTSGSSIVLDAGQVLHADSSLAQLIVSLRAEATRNGVRVAIDGKDEAAFLHTLTSSDADSCSIPVGTPKPGLPGGKA